MSKQYFPIAAEVLQIEADALLHAKKTLGEEIDRAVSLMHACSGKCIVTGVGKSGLVGAKIAATLASTGTPAFFIHPTEALHGDLGMIGPEDLVLAISYSGESEELTRILPHIKRFDIPLIALASNPKSTLAGYADAFLSIHVNQEACPLNVAPTSSTTLTLALGDALAVCLMKKQHFKVEDFANFHPGGSLGKRLFVKVSDLMRTDNLPTVRQEAIVKEALLVMSEGRLGNVLILDAEKKLVGILSDGDLRRALMRPDFNINENVMRYATPSPRTCSDSHMLAIDALEIIEKYKIQLLVVCNKQNGVLGVLHIHDLIEAGIKQS